MTSEGASGAARNLPIASEEAGTGVGHGEARTLHERHVRTRGSLLSISPNRWQASKWVGWDADLGHFWADLGLGPKSKVVACTHALHFLFNGHGH
jgi:hypothetical protein